MLLLMRHSGLWPLVSLLTNLTCCLSYLYFLDGIFLYSFDVLCDAFCLPCVLCCCFLMMDLIEFIALKDVY